MSPPGIGAATGAAEDSDPAVVDAAAQQDLRDTLGDDIFDEILDALRDNLGRLMKDIAEAATQHDAAAAARAAHALKGATLNLGFTLIAHHAARLEAKGKGGTAPAADDMAVIRHAVAISFPGEDFQR